jgi:hypothetical protein
MLCDLRGAQYVILLYREDFVNEIQKYLKGKPDHVSAVNGGVTVEKLL